MSAWRLLAAVAVLFALAVLALWLGDEGASSASKTRGSATSISNSALMATSFPDLAGRNQPLGQWQGKLLIINFWASWCAPCIEEMPIFDSIYRQNVAKNVQIVGIAADTVVNARDFQLKHPVSYPLLVDAAGAMVLSKRLGNKMGLLPHSVVFSPDGRLVLSKLGKFTRAELEAIVVENTQK